MQEACVYLQIPGSICRIYDSICKLIIVYCFWIFCCSSICRKQVAICNFIVLFAECSLLFAAYSVLFADPRCYLQIYYVCVSVQYAVLFFAESSLLFAAYSVLIAEFPVLFANLLCVPFPFSMQFFFLQNPVCYLQLTSFYLQNPQFYLQKLLCVPLPVQYAVLLFAESSLLFAAYFVLFAESQFYL